MAKQINFKRNPILTISGIGSFLVFGFNVWRDYDQGGFEAPLYAGIQALLALFGLVTGVWFLLNPYYAIIKGKYLYIYEDIFKHRVKINLFDYEQVTNPKSKIMVLITADHKERTIKIHSVESHLRSKLLKVVNKVIQAKQSQ